MRPMQSFLNFPTFMEQFDQARGDPAAVRFLVNELVNFENFSQTLTEPEHFAALLSDSAICADKRNLTDLLKTLCSLVEQNFFSVLVPNIDFFLRLFSPVLRSNTVAAIMEFNQWRENFLLDYLFTKKGVFDRLLPGHAEIMAVIKALPNAERRMVNYLIMHKNDSFFSRQDSIDHHLNFADYAALFELVDACKLDDSKFDLLSHFFSMPRAPVFLKAIQKRKDLIPLFIRFLENLDSVDFIPLVLNDKRLSGYGNLSLFDLLAESPWNELNSKLMSAVKYGAHLLEVFSRGEPSVILQKISKIDKRNHVVILELLKNAEFELFSAIFKNLDHLLNFLNELSSAPVERDMLLLAVSSPQFLETYFSSPSNLQQLRQFCAPDLFNQVAIRCGLDVEALAAVPSSAGTLPSRKRKRGPKDDGDEAAAAPPRRSARLFEKNIGVVDAQEGADDFVDENHQSSKRLKK